MHHTDIDCVLFKLVNNMDIIELFANEKKIFIHYFEGVPKSNDII